MRVMMMIKGDPEPGAAPSEELLTAMGRYNDELKQAGVLIDLGSSWGRPCPAGDRGGRTAGGMSCQVSTAIRAPQVLLRLTE
jgi:hypothetical protein